METSRLTNLELYMEDGEYYLRAEYEKENELSLRKVTIPKIYLPVTNYPDIHADGGRSYYHLDLWQNHSIDLGFGQLLLEKCKDGYLYKEEVLKEYPQKMTLEEIEKKLGHKVEIVSGK